MSIIIGIDLYYKRTKERKTQLSLTLGGGRRKWNTAPPKSPLRAKLSLPRLQANPRAREKESQSGPHGSAGIKDQLHVSPFNSQESMYVHGTLKLSFVAEESFRLLFIGSRTVEPHRVNATPEEWPASLLGAVMGRSGLKSNRLT